MVQTQQLWVSELSSATGRSIYGLSSPALQVQLPEHLVGACSLGQVVHIIGHASCGRGPAGQANAGCIQVSNHAGQGTDMQYACLVSSGISGGVVACHLRSTVCTCSKRFNAPGCSPACLQLHAHAHRVRAGRSSTRHPHISPTCLPSLSAPVLTHCVSCAQVKANDLQLVLPHMTWTLLSALAASLKPLQQQPLHHMWELLTTALGHNTPIDPHVAVGMLLSAAAVGSGGSRGACAGPRQSEQVRKRHVAFA